LNKYIKYSLLLAAFALLAYKSVYFKKLSEVKSNTTEKFNAAAFTKKLWDEKLPAQLDSAVELTGLIKAVAADANAAFEKYTNAMAVGNYRYTMVKTDAEVLQVNEDDVLIQLPFADSLLKIKVATEFVYGNAIRDASKLLQVKDFPITTDLNSISEELNKMVRTDVLIPFKKAVEKGDKVAVTGAIEINKAHINWSEPEIIPVRLQIKN
jgi:predicted lipoprotein